MSAKWVEATIFGIAWVALFVCFLILCSIPGRVARQHNRPNASLINICGWVGAVIWPLLIVAFIWAYSKPRIKQSDGRKQDDSRALGFPVKVLPLESAGETPGRYRIVGVVRSTGTDVKTYIDAASRANAMVKAELKGIIVTSIDEV